MTQVATPHWYAGALRFTSQTPRKRSQNRESSTRKPLSLRKKSGELVQPILHPPTTYHITIVLVSSDSKTVHFDSVQLKNIHYFFQADSPDCQGSAPSTAVRLKQHQIPYCYLDTTLSNLPTESTKGKIQPVHLERLWLSDDGKLLKGLLAASNLAYHKVVTYRFTFDDWTTTSDIRAHYLPRFEPQVPVNGYDSFVFSISLINMINVDSKTMHCCIQYCVRDQEFWDNNSGRNFQVKLRC